ncbi:glycosyltransferase [Staphylococcus aureus]|nr:glycosyltransferase [Staphylococcus aureus]
MFEKKFYYCITKICSYEKYHTYHFRYKYCKKKVKDVKLHIYGTGTQKENYTKLIKKLKLQDNVFIHDYAFDIRALYTKTSLSVLTSDYEGLPMSLLEAMSYGVPVISYPINYGPKSIIQNNINGIITKKKDNINELAKK